MPPKGYVKRTAESMRKRKESDRRFNMWDKDGNLIIEDGKLVKPSKDKKE